MGITSAMYTGISGLSANSTAINVIGNNIANVNTTGYKSARTMFADMIYQGIGNNSQVGSGVRVQKIDNLMGQSSFQSTGNATDLAIDGNGFFTVQDANGNNFYTRAGDFTVDENGQFLVNPDGMRLCDSAGGKIDVSGLANFSAITKVDTDGTITWQDKAGATALAVQKVGIATCQNPAGLTRQGDTLFIANAAGGGSGPVLTGLAATSNSQIRSNSLELSNVDISTELVNLITTQRAYSANSKTITSADQMTQDTLNMIR